MRILFIYSIDDAPSRETPLRNPGEVQLGISSISAVLKQAGYETDVLVLGSNNSDGITQQLLRERMESLEPQLVCMTAVATQYDFISDIASYIRIINPATFLLVGGVHPSLNPDSVIIDDFDAICIGEGEYATKELADQLAQGKQPSDIHNLWIKTKAGVLRKNPTRPFIEDLDSLPFPDRAIWEPYIMQAGRKRTILAGRGCPYNCTYCSNHALRTLAGGKYVRMRSAQNIVDEIKYVRSTYPETTCIYLEVETITTKKTFVFELCRELKRLNVSSNPPFSFGTNFRVSKDVLDPDIFKAFQSANFEFINIGLESGSERVRRDVLHRNYTNEQFMEAISLAKSHGLFVCVYNMIGLPGETPQDHMKTVLLNRAVNPEVSHTSIFFPYPGTDLYDICKARGIIKGKLDPNMERKKAALDLPEFPRVKVQHAFNWFEYRIYKGQGRMSTRHLFLSAIERSLKEKPLLVTALTWARNCYRKLK